MPVTAPDQEQQQHRYASPGTTTPTYRAPPPPKMYEVDYAINITRLYEAITSEEWDEALDAVSRRPSEARTWVVRYDKEDGTGGIQGKFLPIHSACARQPPADVVSALIAAFPEGVEAADDQGM